MNAAAEEADVLQPVDAVLFFLTHDVMRSRAALERVLSYTRSGARVVAFGAKMAPWWSFPLNLLVWLIGRSYVTTYEGTRRPWSVLAELIPDLRLRRRLAGCVYFAWGTVPGGA